MEAFRRHLVNYMSGVDLSPLSIPETETETFYDEIINQYFSVRAGWVEKGVMREHSESTALGGTDVPASDRGKRFRSPIVWWCTGSIVKPRDPFQRKAAEELIDFAIRTLSVSPTATATERTFSLECRIHTVQRASLAPEKVRKILFCQWNSRVLRRSVQRDEIDIKWEIERQMEGMRKLRSVRAAIVSAAKGVSKETSTQPTSTDQNTRLVASVRQTNDSTANRSFTEGSTFESQQQPQSQPPPEAPRLQYTSNMRCGQLEASVREQERHVTHVGPADMGQPPPRLAVGSESGGQSWVSELFKAAVSTALELHGVKNQVGTTGEAVGNIVPGMKNALESQDLRTTNEGQSDKEQTNEDSESPRKKLRRT